MADINLCNLSDYQRWAIESFLADAGGPNPVTKYAVWNALRYEASFLYDRIENLEWSDFEEFQRDWNGHVEPPLHRLRRVLDALAVDRPADVEQIIGRLLTCAEQSDMGRNFSDTPQACREAASLLIGRVGAEPVQSTDSAAGLIRYYQQRGLDDLGAGEVERLFEAAIVLAQAPDRTKLAEVVHTARFPEDRVPDPFESEDRRGREYCFRIADAVTAFFVGRKG